MPITTARRLAVKEQSREKRALRHSEVCRGEIRFLVMRHTAVASPHIPFALLQQGRETTDGRNPLTRRAAIDPDDVEEDVDTADSAAQVESGPTAGAVALDDGGHDLRASLEAAEGRAAAAEAKAAAAEARAAVAQAEAAALRIRLDLAAKALGALQSALCDQEAK
jgi:hypothetical protein